MKGVLASLAVVASMAGPSEAVVGGTASRAFPGIGYLLNQATGDACSAVLIGERTVLTAAHCLNDDLHATSLDPVHPSNIEFYPGSGESDVRDFSRYRGAKLIQNPAFAGAARADIAVVILERTPPASIARIPLALGAPIVGETIDIVGHGFYTTRKAGEKYIGRNTVATVAPTYYSIVGKTNICDGDSGGGSLVYRGTETLLMGIHTGRATAGCGTTGYDMRVDTYRDWIVQVSGGDVVFGHDPVTAIPSTDDKTDGEIPDVVDGEIETGGGCSTGRGGQGGGLALVLLALSVIARRPRPGTRAS